MHFSTDSASTSTSILALPPTKIKPSQKTVCRRPATVTPTRRAERNDASTGYNNNNCNKAVEAAVRRASIKHTIAKQRLAAPVSDEMIKFIERLFDQEPIDADILSKKLPGSGKKSRRHARHVRRSADAEPKAVNDGDTEMMALLLVPIPRDERMLLNEVENAMPAGSTPTPPAQEERLQGSFDSRKSYDELEDDEEAVEEQEAGAKEEDAAKKKSAHQFLPIHIPAVQRRSIGNRRSVHPCRWKLCGAYHNYQNGFRLFTK